MKCYFRLVDEGNQSTTYMKDGVAIIETTTKLGDREIATKYPLGLEMESIKQPSNLDIKKQQCKSSKLEMKKH